MLNDRSFATRTISTGAAGKLLAGFGCIWLLFCGLCIAGVGIGVASGIKYLAAS